MNKPIQNPSSSDLEVAAEQAEAELVRLKDIADDLEAETKKLTKAFEAEPSEAVFAQKAVAAQKYNNAAAAVVEQQKAVNAAHGAVATARHNAIGREIAAKEAAAVERFHEAIDLIVQGISELDGAIGGLAAHQGDRLDAQRQGVGLGQLTLPQIVAQLVPKLAPFQGRNSYDRQSLDAQLVLLGSGRDAMMALNIRRPIAIIPANMRP